MQLPLIDDARSIQKAISVVLNSLAAGTLDATQARAMLYGLQIAATNARHIASQISEPVEKDTDRSEPIAAVEPVAAVVPCTEEIAAPVASPPADIVPAAQPQQNAVADISQQQGPMPEAELSALSRALDETPIIVAAQQEKRQEKQESTAHAVRNPAPPARLRDYTEIRRERMRTLGHRRPLTTL
jgi:hypothetical protein